MAKYKSRRASISVQRADYKLTMKSSDTHFELREIDAIVALIRRLAAWISSLF